MFSHVMVGSNDIERSKRFYDAVLGVLGAGEPLRNLNGTGQVRLWSHRAKSVQACCVLVRGVCVLRVQNMLPQLGGYLTDAFDWRYVFYVNLPFGILATIGLGIILEWCAAQTCSTGPSTLAALSVHWRGVRALAVAALASPPTVHTPTLATVPSIFLG